MKKTILFIISIICIISACEKDDFCTKNPVTPYLVLRFYDNINREDLKKVDNLSVWIEGRTDSIYKESSTDSIAIPLDNLTNQTIYNFSSGTTIDTFTIDYTPEEDYVSRSCGFRIIFNNVIFTPTNNWIVDFTPVEPITIDHQNSAHVQIFH